MSTFLVNGFRERSGICTLLNWEKLLERCRSEATLSEVLKHNQQKGNSQQREPEERPKYSSEV